MRLLTFLSYGVTPSYFIVWGGINCFCFRRNEFFFLMSMKRFQAKDVKTTVLRKLTLRHHIKLLFYWEKNSFLSVSTHKNKFSNKLKKQIRALNKSLFVAFSRKNFNEFNEKVFPSRPTRLPSAPPSIYSSNATSSSDFKAYFKADWTDQTASLPRRQVFSQTY